MPLPKMEQQETTSKDKRKCDHKCRHAEYYDMQKVFDSLYSRSKVGESFTDLMPLILSRENILLAYRNNRQY